MSKKTRLTLLHIRFSIAITPNKFHEISIFSSGYNPNIDPYLDTVTYDPQAISLYDLLKGMGITVTMWKRDGAVYGPDGQRAITGGYGFIR